MLRNFKKKRQWKFLFHTVSLHNSLTHWCRVIHICIGNLTITGSDNGFALARRRAIIWTNAGILLIGPLGTKFSDILIAIHTFSFKKMHFKLSSAKWQPFRLGLDMLNRPQITRSHPHVYNSIIEYVSTKARDTLATRAPYQVRSTLYVSLYIYIYIYICISLRWRIVSSEICYFTSGLGASQ